MDAMKISDTEFVVMEVVWKYDGPVTFSQIRKELNQSEWAESTIRSMVRRLVDKGVLIQNKNEGNLFTFSPSVSREEYVEAQTKDLLGRVYGGNITELKAAITDYEVNEDKLQDLKLKWRRRRKERDE